MKTLANCSPRDFLRQSNRIRKRVAAWLDATRIMEIRKKMPTITEEMSDEQKKEAARKQARENIEQMLDTVLEQHPDETAELLGLLCFIDPEDLDNHTMLEFLPAVTELLESKDVLDFFISLGNLAQIGFLT